MRCTGFVGCLSCWLMIVISFRYTSTNHMKEEKRERSWRKCSPWWRHVIAFLCLKIAKRNEWKSITTWMRINDKCNWIKSDSSVGDIKRRTMTDLLSASEGIAKKSININSLPLAPPTATRKLIWFGLKCQRKFLWTHSEQLLPFVRPLRCR